VSYIAITQQTANWLLNNKDLISIIYDFLNSNDNAEALKETAFAEGPLRISGDVNGKVYAVWNVDYLSGTGEESWGFIKKDDPFGVMGSNSIGLEMFERCHYVINQRLQGLLLDTSLIHRSYDNGTHTCIAGRGSEAFRYSLCYAEGEIQTESFRTKSILCIGPSKENEVMSSKVHDLFKALHPLVSIANDLLALARRRPLLDATLSDGVRRVTIRTKSGEEGALKSVTVPMQNGALTEFDVYNTYSNTYDEWTAAGSCLSQVQRRILESDTILSHPLRITGPGGSGKSLLMQLLAFRRLRADQDGGNFRILYIVHNAAMAQNVIERFVRLGAEEYLTSNPPTLCVFTLAEYGRKELDLHEATVIDVDAHATKVFQLTQIESALRKSLADLKSIAQDSPLFSLVESDINLFNIVSRLVMMEISVAIKGHGLINDEKRYVGSERRLSRFHGLLQPSERKIVFNAFRHYHHAVFEEFQVLDSDDIALSLLGRFRTPIWELKRKSMGFDFVFVDETQLFNENERKLFSLLTKGNSRYVPIALALDEAQEPYSASAAGLGILGIEELANETLPSNHRSIKAIVDLAFFVIQRTTDLFSPDFPDFTGICEVMLPNSHPLAKIPRVESSSGDSRTYSKFVIRKIRELRRNNIRQIAVVCHADQYWDDLEKELSKSDLPLHVLLQRGDKVAVDQPMVVLTRPAYVGGQEFDAVIAIGLEQGLYPPRSIDNEALTVALEQQCFREIYLTFTRAKFQLVILMNRGSRPSAIIQEAIAAHLIEE